MKTDNTHNGWSNYETWNAKLWIDNDQGSQEYWQERAEACLQDAIDNDESDIMASASQALADELESSHDDNMPEVSGVYSDLLQAASNAIDWREIADSMLSDFDVYSAGWNMPGYMPDNAPALFLDAVDALSYIKDEIERADEEREPIDVSTIKADKHGEFGQTIGAYHYFVSKV